MGTNGTPIFNYKTSVFSEDAGPSSHRLLINIGFDDSLGADRVFYIPEQYTVYNGL